MIPTREQIYGDWSDPRYSKDTVVREWLRAMRDEIDRLTAELAALKPSEDREAAIRAWEAGAMAVEDDGDYHPIDVYRVTLGEIRDAVALMRSAGDPDAKLRELRAKMVGHGYLDLDLPMRTIDEMLAQSAPVEQPAAAVPETFHNEFHAAFAKASEPLIKFLNDHPERLHPHHTVIVTQTGAELLEGSMSHKTTKHVRD